VKDCVTGCFVDELGETADTLQEFLARAGPPDDFVRGLVEHFAEQLKFLDEQCGDCQAEKKTEKRVAEFRTLLHEIRQKLDQKPKILRRVRKCRSQAA
jgi:hypothetical protein